MGELKQGSDTHIGAIVWTEEKHLRQTVRQLIYDNLNGMRITQTILAAAIHTPDRDASPLEGAVTGSWSLGIVEQSQGKGCCGETDEGRRLWWEMPSHA